MTRPSPARRSTSPCCSTLEGSTLSCLEESGVCMMCNFALMQHCCSVSIRKKWILSYIPRYDLYGDLLRMSPHPKSISLTSDVSLFISRLPNLTSRWSTPRRWHMFVAWAACHMICRVFSSSRLPPWRLMNCTRFSQGEGHSRTMTKWSGWSVQSNSLMISGTLGPLFARMVRAISFGRGTGWSG